MNLARWIVGQLRAQVRGPRRGDRSRSWCANRVARSRRYSSNANRERSAHGEWLGERFASSRVELFHIDALDFDLRSLYGSGTVKIIGNLPYYAATALIAKYTSALSPASMLVLTLQWEVAERLLGRRAQKNWCDDDLHITALEDSARKASASVFHPKPQVSSAVVIFERKAMADIAPCDEVLFEDWFVADLRNAGSSCAICFRSIRNFGRSSALLWGEGNCPCRGTLSRSVGATLPASETDQGAASRRAVLHC